MTDHSSYLLGVRCHCCSPGRPPDCNMAQNDGQGELVPTCFDRIRYHHYHRPCRPVNDTVFCFALGFSFYSPLFGLSVIHFLLFFLRPLGCVGTKVAVMYFHGPSFGVIRALNHSSFLLLILSLMGIPIAVNALSWPSFRIPLIIIVYEYCYNSPRNCCTIPPCSIRFAIPALAFRATCSVYREMC